MIEEKNLDELVESITDAVFGFGVAREEPNDVDVRNFEASIKEMIQGFIVVSKEEVRLAETHPDSNIRAKHKVNSSEESIIK